MSRPTIGPVLKTAPAANDTAQRRRRMENHARAHSTETDSSWGNSTSAASMQPARDKARAMTAIRRWPQQTRAPDGNAAGIHGEVVASLTDEHRCSPNSWATARGTPVSQGSDDVRYARLVVGPPH